MDRMIYTAMTGAKHILNQQATNSHNLANVNSTGFRAQVDGFRAVPIVSEGLNTRAFVVDATTGTDFSPGPIQHTGRSLDIAINTKGWIAVQRPDGSEAYTRNGALGLNANGMLITSQGLPVIGDGGPISIPPDVTITIASEGTISVVNNLSQPGPTNILDRLKLVNPNEQALVRGEDGLFSLPNNRAADVDTTVRITSGAIEGSNVNVVHSMVNMISLARQFDVQMKLMQNAENNAAKASQLFNLTS